MSQSRFTISRRSLDREALREAVLAKLVYDVGKDPERASRHDWFRALALAVRDRLADRWMATPRDVAGRRAPKRVPYPSPQPRISPPATAWSAAGWQRPAASTGSGTASGSTISASSS